MVIALILILGGGFFAFLVQTGGGDISHPRCPIYGV